MFSGTMFAVALFCVHHLTCTVMRRITTFRSTTDPVYDGGPII